MLYDKQKKFTLYDKDNRKKVKVTAIRVGSEWQALCPFHNDTHPSLSINEEKGVYYCHGCEKRGRIYSPDYSRGSSVIIATYDYRNEEGRLLYQAVRFKPKRFAYRRPDCSGEWIYNIKGVKRILYRLPELTSASLKEPVLIVEGEKDVDSLARLGFVSTSSPMGAGKWREEYDEYLRDRRVVLIPDNDEEGRHHCEIIGNNLRGVAKSIKWLELPGLKEKEDISDWLENGGTKEELIKLIENAKNYRSELDILAKSGAARSRVVIVDFSSLLPKKDFISQYIRYASKLTDAPPIYHEVVGLILLATITEGKVKFRNINANIYAVLVGKSTIMRKSASIDIGNKILYKIDKNLIIPPDFSPEAFIDRLEANSKGLIYWSEFGQFLSASGRSYMVGIKETITDLFDCPEERKKILRNREIIIKNPYICIVTATTKAWMKVDKKDLVGGFLSRYIFINAEPSEKDRNYLIPPGPDVEGEIKIMDMLKKLRKLKFEIRLSTRAVELYKKFKESFSKEMEAINDEKGESGFLGRLEIYALKLAMLYQISEKTQKIIRQRAMGRAIKLVRRAKADILELLENQLGNSPFENERQRVLSLIKKKGMISRTKLMQGLKSISKDYLDKILDTLIGAEQIEENKEKAAGKRDKRLYKIVE